jgi:hypothetical protein
VALLINSQGLYGNRHVNFAGPGETLDGSRTKPPVEATGRQGISRMAVVLYILGVLSALAGLAAIAYGIPVKEFSFGNTLIESGSVGFVGGLIVIGLAAAIGQLHRVVDMLGARPLQRMDREFEGARVPFPPKPKVNMKAEPPKVERAAVPPPPMAVDASDEFNPPSLPNPDVPLVAEAETETAPLSPAAPMPPAPRREFAPPPLRDVAPPPGPDVAPPKSPQRFRPTLADERVRAPLEPPPPKWPETRPPTFEPPPAEDVAVPPVAESSEPPFFEPPATEPAPRAPEPAGFEPPPAPADLSVSDEPAAEPPWRKPRAERPSFDEIWPAQPRAPFAPHEPTRAAESIARASTPENESGGEPEPQGGPEPPVEETAESDRAEAPVAILKSGVVDGMGYTLYVDGSIEAELPDGTLRFASINELRAHLERNS